MESCRKLQGEIGILRGLQVKLPAQKSAILAFKSRAAKQLPAETSVWIKPISSNRNNWGAGDALSNTSTKLKLETAALGQRNHTVGTAEAPTDEVVVVSALPANNLGTGRFIVVLSRKGEHVVREARMSSHRQDLCVKREEPQTLRNKSAFGALVSSDFAAAACSVAIHELPAPKSLQCEACKSMLRSSYRSPNQ